MLCFFALNLASIVSCFSLVSDGIGQVLVRAAKCEEGLSAAWLGHKLGCAESSAGGCDGFRLRLANTDCGITPASMLEDGEQCVRDEGSSSITPGRWSRSRGVSQPTAVPCNDGQRAGNRRCDVCFEWTCLQTGQMSSKVVLRKGQKEWSPKMVGAAGRDLPTVDRLR